MAKQKRGNAEGSVYKMQDGRWRAAVSVGKPVATTVATKTSSGSLN